MDGLLQGAAGVSLRERRWGCAEACPSRPAAQGPRASVPGLGGLRPSKQLGRPALGDGRP